MNADVVVVGAGCIGASAAVHLARAGVRDVVLLDKQGPAAMTTGRSSAIVRTHYSQPTYARWALESLLVWRQFDEMFGGDPVLTHTGWAIAGGPDDAEPMRKTVELLCSIGVRTEMLSLDELAKLEPSAKFDEFACAAYEPDAGYCDPGAASAGFARAFEQLGGRTMYGVRVAGLERSGSTWRLETSDGVIESPTVVNAAGGYARSLAAQAGLQVPIEHYAHDICVFSSGGAPKITIYDLVAAAYFRPAGSGEVLVGSMNWSEGARVLDDPDAFPWTANPQVVARHARCVFRRFPSFDPQLARSHAGIYFITPDRYPILGEDPAAPGLFLACGFSHGFKTAPAIGRTIAARIVDGAGAVPELDAFRLSRFAEGKPITPLYPYPSGIQA
jgi:sarcosine oxidase subunit beta